VADEPDQPIHVTTTEARSGSKEGVVRYVLIISLTLAIVAMIVVGVSA
jgi:hypothetical protein